MPDGLGVTLGEVLGVTLGEVLGEVTAVCFDDPPRLARKMPPPTPRRSRIAMAAIAGSSQAGRSLGSR